MRTSPSRPEVHSFPSTDEQFRADIARALEHDVPGDPDSLARLLQQAYPRTRVIARYPLDQLIELGPPVWYAFRDGAIVSDDGEA